MLSGTATLALFLACSYIFSENQGFCFYKIVLIKKEYSYDFFLGCFILIFL